MLKFVLFLFGSVRQARTLYCGFARIHQFGRPARLVEIRQNLLDVQAVIDWSSVPEHIGQAKTLKGFKNVLMQNI